MNIVYEEFNDIDELLKTLSTRSNNAIMRDNHSSEKEGDSFSKTSSYKEATDLLKNGYTDILEDVKSAVRRNNKFIYQYQDRQRKVKNMPIGFIPNVPNALQNKPDAMINIIHKPKKRKTINIIYAMSGSCGESADVFVKAGAALVSALNLIEISGIQTRLSVSFMASESSRSFFSFYPETKDEDKQFIFPILRVKNYGERFNLTKICFPMAHPSMFRRIGFKYLETCPQLTDSNFANGYGRVPDLNEIREIMNTDENTYILNTSFIKENDYDIHKILKELEVVI